MEYAIKIDGKYFKEYIYADEEYARSRNAGHSRLAGRIQEGDIIDIVLTDKIERTEVRRSVGNTITTLYSIQSIRDKNIKIIALK